MRNTPEKGDIVVIDADSGNIRRHMVVMSSSDYNKSTGFILGMPITTSQRVANRVGYYPILIPGDKHTGVKGYVVVWQLQNFDYISRHGVIINKINHNLYKELLVYVKDMLDL
jgi:mRNA interferase MazF